MKLHSARYLPLLFGMALALYAAPRLVESLIHLPGDSTLGQMENSMEVQQAGLEVLIQSREMSSAVSESGEGWNEISMARIHLANKQPEGSPQRGEIMAQALEAQQTALSLQPANPHAWLRLAYINVKLEQKGKAAAAMDMSYRTGPYELQLAEYRLSMSAYLWENLGDDTRMMVYEEARLLQEQKPKRLAALMEKNSIIREIATAIKQ